MTSSTNFSLSELQIQVRGLEPVFRTELTGVGPIDPNIRQTVLSSLDERFDKHLSQAENVRSLFIALNDESFQNRLTAVNLIGRLALHNPAYVMASLRKALIQILTELEYSTNLCVLSRPQNENLLTSTLLAGTSSLAINHVNSFQTWFEHPRLTKKVFPRE